jgi:hypothetical protein
LTRRDEVQGAGLLQIPRLEEGYIDTALERPSFVEIWKAFTSFLGFRLQCKSGLTMETSEVPEV